MRDIPTYSRTPMKTVYLDYHATTPVDPRVLEAMLPFYGPKFGNAASGTHRFGWEAEGAVEVARQRIALLAGAEAREIVFTDRKSVGEGKSVDLGGRRIIKKKKDTAVG